MLLEIGQHSVDPQGWEDRIHVLVSLWMDPPTKFVSMSTAH